MFKISIWSQKGIQLPTKYAQPFSFAFSISYFWQLSSSILSHSFRRLSFPFGSACSQLNRNWFVWLAVVAHTHTDSWKAYVCECVWVVSLVFHAATFVNIKWAFCVDCDSIERSADNLLIFIKKFSTLRAEYPHELQVLNIDFNYVKKCEIPANQLRGIVCRLLTEETSRFVFVHRQQETHTHTRTHNIKTTSGTTNGVAFSFCLLLTARGLWFICQCSVNWKKREKICGFCWRNVNFPESDCK